MDNAKPVSLFAETWYAISILFVALIGFLFFHPRKGCQERKVAGAEDTVTQAAPPETIANEKPRAKPSPFAKKSQKKGAKQAAKAIENDAGVVEQFVEAKPVEPSPITESSPPEEETTAQKAVVEVAKPKIKKAKCKAACTTKAVEPVKIVEQTKAVSPKVDVLQAVEASMAMAAAKTAEAEKSNVRKAEAKKAKDQEEVHAVELTHGTASECSGGPPMSALLGVTSADDEEEEAHQVESEDGPMFKMMQKEPLRVKNQKLKRKEETPVPSGTTDKVVPDTTAMKADIRQTLTNTLAACSAMIADDFAPVLPSKESKAQRKAAAVEKQQQVEEERAKEDRKARICAQERAEERKRQDELEQERRLQQLDLDRKNALKDQLVQKPEQAPLQSGQIEELRAGQTLKAKPPKTSHADHIQVEDKRGNVDKKRKTQWKTMLQEFAWENFEGINYTPTYIQYPGEEPRDGTTEFKNQLEMLGVCSSVAIHSTLDGHSELPFMPADMQMHSGTFAYELPTMPNDLMMQPMPEYLLMQPQDFIQDPLPKFSDDLMAEEVKGPYCYEEKAIERQAIPECTEFIPDPQALQNLMPTAPALATLDGQGGKVVCWDMKMMGVCSRGDFCPWSHSDGVDDSPEPNSDWVLKPPFTTGKIPMIVPQKSNPKVDMVDRGSQEEEWVLKPPFTEKTRTKTPAKAKTALTLGSSTFIPAGVFEELENQLVGLGFA